MQNNLLDSYSLAEKACKEIQQEIDKYLLTNLYRSILFCEERERYFTDSKCFDCPYNEETGSFESKCSEDYLCKFIDENDKPDLNKAIAFYEKHCTLLGIKESLKRGK